MHPLHHLLDLFIPRRCAVCGATLLGGENCLCTSCILEMPLTYFWDEEHNPMADKLNARIQSLRDLRGITGFEPYSYAAALFFYKSGYRGLSQQLKYDANLTVGRYVADALGRKLASSSIYSDVDMIVPVPLHWTRRLHRGYNQSEVIASQIAYRICGRIDTGILRRTRRTASQARRDVSAKASNVAGAFSASFAAPLDCPRHILLVDDVFTSGSTLAECHTALRAALVVRFGSPAASGVKISVATLAVVGD